MKTDRKKLIKTIGLLISVLLVFSCLVGCAREKKSENASAVDLFQVEEKDGTITSKGKVNIQGTGVVLLTVEAGESTSGTFHISYTKDQGALQINQGDDLILSLGNGAETVSDLEEMSVELEKGSNEFILSGEECECEFTVSLYIPDQSQIISFGGATLK